MKFYLMITTLLTLGLTFNANGQNNYKKEWSKVDSLEKKGLYNMALKEVNKIFDKATKNKNHNQVIKTVFYELKFNSYLKEDDYILGIYRLEELIQQAPSPSKEILHSITAEVYWGYYSANMWKYANRTTVEEDVKLNDIRTWDLKRIAKKVIYHYKKSLENSGISQTSPIENFNDIIFSTEDTKDFRPTLFDFLAHRAIEFFKSNSFNLPGSAETFVINHPDYFSNNTTFLNLNIKNIDEFNTKFYATIGYKLLTDFHLRTKNNQSALLMLEFERLNFVKEQSVLSNKDELYEKALVRMTKVYPNNPHITEVLFAIAKIHYHLGEKFDKSHPEYQWEKKKAYAICEQAINKFPKSFGAKQCKVLQSKINKKAFGFQTEMVFVPKQNNLFYLNYQNVNQAYVKIIPIKNIGKFNHLKESKQLEFLNKESAVFEKTFTLKTFGDYQSHSTELLLPPLNIGTYLIASSNQPTFTSKSALTYDVISVSNLTFQTLIQNEQASVLVTDRSTGKPVKDAVVTVKYNGYSYKLRKYVTKLIGKFTTPTNGLITFKDDKSKDRNSGHYYFEVEKGDDKFNPSNSFYFYNRTSTESKPYVTTNFFYGQKNLPTGTNHLF